MSQYEPKTSVAKPWKHYIHGSLYYITGGYELALGEYQALLKVDPQDIMGHYGIGLIHLAKNDLSEAYESFLAAFRIIEKKLGSIGPIKGFVESDAPAKTEAEIKKELSLLTKSGQILMIFGIERKYMDISQKYYAEAMKAYGRSVRIRDMGSIRQAQQALKVSESVQKMVEFLLEVYRTYSKASLSYGISE